MVIYPDPSDDSFGILLTQAANVHALHWIFLETKKSRQEKFRIGL